MLWGFTFYCLSRTRYGFFKSFFISLLHRETFSALRVLTLFQNMTYNATELDIMMYLKVELPFSYKLDPYPTEPQGEDLRFINYTHKRGFL